MIFTQQRRRLMNKEVKALYPYIEFYESSNGIPVMECKKLPKGAVRIIDAEDFISKVSKYLTRKNDLDLTLTDYSKAYPVFIESLELRGNETRRYYRVNYIWESTESQQKAMEYISEGKLFAVLSCH